MVYILLADGFEEIEALAPCDMLRRADVEVRLVSVTEKLHVSGTHGISIMADLTVSEMNSRDIDMLVFPERKTWTSIREPIFLSVTVLTGTHISRRSAPLP